MNWIIWSLLSGLGLTFVAFGSVLMAGKFK
jgi:hypothetical protein